MGKWGQIEAEVPGRTAEQCKFRFYNTQTPGAKEKRERQAAKKTERKGDRAGGKKKRRRSSKAPTSKHRRASGTEFSNHAAATEPGVPRPPSSPPPPKKRRQASNRSDKGKTAKRRGRAEPVELADGRQLSRASQAPDTATDGELIDGINIFGWTVTSSRAPRITIRPETDAMGDARDHRYQSLRQR